MKTNRHPRVADQEPLESLVIAHKRMSRAGIHPDIMPDAELIQVSAQASGLTGEDEVFLAVSGEYGTTTLKRLRFARHRAVEVRCYSDRGSSGVEDGEAAAQAESGYGLARFVDVVRRGRSAFAARAASMSSNARPLPLRNAFIVRRMQSGLSRGPTE